MILKNGRVLVQEDSNINFKKIDIRIKDNIISELSKDIIYESNEECIDLNGDYILPGLVNSHYHSYTNILKGTSFGEPLELWSFDTIALGKILSDCDMEISVLLGICEMLRSGVTACVDHLPHLATSHKAARTYENTGFRSGLAPMLHNIPDSDILYKINISKTKSGKNNIFSSTLDYIDFYTDFINNFHKPDKNIQVIVGINSPQRADDNLLEAASELAHKYDLPIHSHLLETKWQKISVDHDESPLLKMDRLNLLGNKTSLAHCIWLNNDELDLLAERNSIVVSNPTSNCFIGSGIFNAKEFLKRNIKITLGSDGLNCGTNNNMLEVLKIFLLLQRTQSSYTNWITSNEAFKMVSQNASDILGTYNPIGQIAKNCSADLVVVDKNSFLDILDKTLPIQLIFNTSTLPVKHVMINGNMVMKDYKLVTIDEEGLRKEIEERKPYLKKAMEKALSTTYTEKDIYRSVYESL
jgi:cytosine/adenosine deaminase-related metal-dependent hydrolase